MIPQHSENYKVDRSTEAVCGIWAFYQQSNFGNPPQGLVNTLTIWYIKRDLWGDLISPT